MHRHSFPFIVSVEAIQDTLKMLPIFWKMERCWIMRKIVMQQWNKPISSTATATTATTTVTVQVVHMTAKIIEPLMSDPCHPRSLFPQIHPSWRWMKVMTATLLLLVVVWYPVVPFKEPEEDIVLHVESLLPCDHITANNVIYAWQPLIITVRLLERVLENGTIRDFGGTF